MTLVGTRIGNIRLQERLGTGGMGEVYLGRDEVLERKVAVKTLLAGQRLGHESKARFLREARLLSKVDHPDICQVHDLIEGEGRDYLILEFIEGRTLRQAAPDLPDDESRLRVAERIAAALACAHEHRIVHRDIKPENVMVTPDGGIKVLDFGISRPAQASSGSAGLPVAAGKPGTQAATAPEDLPRSPPGEPPPTRPLAVAPGSGVDRGLTELGVAIGTLHYMSPEQARGDRVDEASDIYSLAIVLQELFSSSPVYEGLPTTRLLEAVGRGDAAPVTGVDEDLGALIEDMKNLDPRRRPTAVEVVERLREVREKPQRLRRRRIRRAAFGAAFALLAIVAVAMSLLAISATRARDEAQQRRGQAEDLIGFMLGDLRQKLTEVGRLEILDDVGERAIRYFESVPAQLLSDEELLKHSRALYQIGEVDVGQGDLESAMSAFQASLRVAEPLVEGNADDPKRAWELGQTTFWVGYVHYLRGDHDTALPFFERYRDIAETWSARLPDDSTWALELAYAHSNLGTIARDQGRHAEALPHLQRALVIQQDLAGRAPDDPERQLDVASSREDLGRLLVKLGRLEEARRQYEANLALVQALVDGAPQNATWRHRLAIAHGYLAHLLLRHLGDAPSALPHAERQLEIASRLSEQDPENKDWSRDLAAANALAGLALAANGALEDEAIEHVQAARGILAELTRSDPSNDDWSNSLVSVELDLDRILTECGG